MAGRKVGIKNPFHLPYFAKREYQNKCLGLEASNVEKAAENFNKEISYENGQGGVECFKWFFAVIPILLAISSYYLADVEGRRIITKLQNDFMQERATREQEVIDLTTRIHKQEETIRWRQQLIKLQEKNLNARRSKYMS
jgi:hypothetical protein